MVGESFDDWTELDIDEEASCGVVDDPLLAPEDSVVFCWSLESETFFRGDAELDSLVGAPRDDDRFFVVVTCVGIHA